MKAGQQAVVGVGLFVVAMVMTVPASLLRRVLPAGLEVGQFAGTVWNGQARDVRWHGQRLSDALGWNWQLLHLLGLNLTFDLQSRWGSQDGRARLTLDTDSLRLSDADLPVPLEPVAASLPALAQYRLRGLLTLTTRDFLWTEGRGDGELGVVWQEARSDYSADAVMGSYRIDLKAVSKGYAVKVHTLDGVFRIEGEGTGAPDKGWSVGAVLSAPPADLPRFATLLAKVGPPNPDGNYVLRYSFR